MSPPAAVPARPITHAPRVLLGSIVLGVLTQALFFRVGLGLDWLVWDLAMIAVTFASLSKGRLRAPALCAAVVAAALGVAFVLRRSAFTAAVAIPSNLVVLAVLPVLVAEDLSFRELATLSTRLGDVVARGPAAIGDTVVLPRDAIAVLDGEGRSVVRRTVTGLLLGLPVSGAFTALLCGDAGFAATVGHVEARLGTAATFAIEAALTASVFAFGWSLFSASTRRASSSAEAGSVAPYRRPDATPRTARVSPLTWGIVVAQVAAVFLVYAIVHRDTELGGHELVRGRAHLTYAGHLHAGFYQLLLATILSVGLVLVGHRLLRAPGDDGPVPGGRALIAVETTLLGLTGAALYSCAHRLRLYEEAYGATHLRLGVAFVVLAALVVLACTSIKAALRGTAVFAPTTLAALATCAVAAAWFDADGYVARANLDRAARGKSLDVAYVASLSADACVAADHPVLRADPTLREALLRAWRSHTHVGDVRALRGVTRCP